MTATTTEDIREWLDKAEPEHTHMIVVCDTFSFEDYPVYVGKDANVEDAVKKFDDVDMQRIMEVYDLSMDFDEQLSVARAFNY